MLAKKPMFKALTSHTRVDGTSVWVIRTPHYEDSLECFRHIGGADDSSRGQLLRAHVVLVVGYGRGSVFKYERG